GLAGFRIGGTARGISSLLSRFNCWLFSWPFSFGGPVALPFPFGPEILIVATSAVRRKIAPPRPATHAFAPPRYTTAKSGELVSVGWASQVTPPSLVASTRP